MAFNISPVYGKQYVRYSETWHAVTNTQAGGVGTVDVGEFRCVAQAVYAGAGFVCPPSALTSFTGPIVGVNQAYIPTSLAEPHTTRQATVATSGSLLVEIDPTDSVAIVLGTALKINTLGQATSQVSGVAATVDGTTPLVREISNIGGRNMAVVSFS